mmetsp:Transcript_27328/g.59678  ORF Transcript_27328/g.59678 Transcript_27328/m.59678 type:complete len:206 (+) Transcript_27328:889-1506(+)
MSAASVLAADLDQHLIFAVLAEESGLAHAMAFGSITLAVLTALPFARFATNRAGRSTIPLATVALPKLAHAISAAELVWAENLHVAMLARPAYVADALPVGALAGAVAVAALHLVAGWAHEAAVAKAGSVDALPVAIAGFGAERGTRCPVEVLLALTFGGARRTETVAGAVRGAGRRRRSSETGLVQRSRTLDGRVTLGQLEVDD